MESALSLGLLFALILFPAVELLRVSYIAVSIQAAVFSAGRFGITGPAGDRPALIKQRIADRAAFFGIDLDRRNISICPVENNNCSPDDAGQPEDFIYIKLTHPVDLLIAGSWRIDLKSETLVKNEPFAST